MTKKFSIDLGLRLEIVVHLLLWTGWIAIFNSGTENGIGYFQQPDHNLFWPLLNGAVFNAALFMACVLWLIPKYLAQKRFAAFGLRLTVISIVYLVLKTLMERLIIFVGIPSLGDISLHQLTVENVYMLIAFIVMGGLYRFSRDWILGVTPSHSTAMNTRSESADSILIKSGSKMHRMAIRDIRYVKSEGNYVVFDDGARRILTYMTMDQVMQQLPGSWFARLHRSYIVAISHIDIIEKNQLKIGNTSIPIGAKYRDDFLERLDASFKPGLG